MRKRKVKHKHKRQSARSPHKVVRGSAVKTLDECIAFATAEIRGRKSLLRMVGNAQWQKSIGSDIKCFQRILEILEAVKIARHDAVHNMPRMVGP